MRRPALTGLPLFSIAVAAVPVAAAVLILPVAPAHAASYTTTDYAARLLTLVNDVRDRHGLRPLEVAGGTTVVASAWTQHLAVAARLSHNPDLGHQLEVHGSKRWQTYGENVGVGAADDPDDLFEAYMKSPAHRDNILDGTFRYVGVAVTFTGDRAWNTFDFVDAYATGTTPARHQVTHDPSQSQPQPVRVFRGATAALHRVAPQPTSWQRPTQQLASADKPHRHAHPVVRVEALHRSVTSVLLASSPMPPMSGTTTVPHLPRSSRDAAVVALAVLALSAAARRWVLAVHRSAM